MARIHMHIEADSAADLRDTLSDLAQLANVNEAGGNMTDERGLEAPEEFRGSTAEYAAAEVKPTRTRRTKEQIAADAAKADPTPAPQSGTQAQTDAGGPSDLEKELLGEGTAQVDYATLASAGTAHIAKHGADKTMAALEQHGGGAKSFKQVPTELYGAVYAALQAELP